MPVNADSFLWQCKGISEDLQVMETFFISEIPVFGQSSMLSVVRGSLLKMKEKKTLFKMNAYKYFAVKEQKLDGYSQSVLLWTMFLNASHKERMECFSDFIWLRVLWTGKIVYNAQFMCDLLEQIIFEMSKAWCKYTWIVMGKLFTGLMQTST